MASCEVSPTGVTSHFQFEGYLAETHMYRGVEGFILQQGHDQHQNGWCQECCSCLKARAELSIGALKGTQADLVLPHILCGSRGAKYGESREEAYEVNARSIHMQWSPQILHLFVQHYQFLKCQHQLQPDEMVSVVMWGK